MVGFKSVWLLILSLVFFAACVPSSKQTECGSNEAFNSQLRQCVPIVQGPTAFININSYTPLYTSTRYKNDNTPVTLTVSVSNPYNQSYTLEWDINYNGVVDTIAGNQTSVSVIPSIYSGNIGSNIITAKVLSGGAVVDTHNFELVIQESPTPNFNTGTIFPADYNPTLFPDNTGQRFSLTERNNNATGLGDYRVFWTLSKNGVNVPAYAETDLLTNTSTAGTNVLYYGTSTTPKFDPSVLGVGSYVLRVRLQNNVSGDVTAEHQWNVVVQQPPLENISNTGLPAIGVTSTAYHAVDYTMNTGYNFTYTLPVPAAAQGRYCVTIDDADGTYDGDGFGVQVKWYLDGVGGDVCTKETTDVNGPQTLCLVGPDNCSGGAPFDTTNLKFFNTASTVTQNHTVVARVFDRAINKEYSATQVTAPPNAYPLAWTVVTKPQNQAPTVGFGTTNPTGCASSGSFGKTGCAVTQGTNFTVSFTVADDFYTPPAVATFDGNQFSYNVELRRNGIAISGTGCTKAFGVNVPAYGTQYTCTMVVPHYDSTGVINPTSGVYTVAATVIDSGSPILASQMTSQTLTWGLTIAESNPSALAVTAQGNNNATSYVGRDTPLPAIVLDPAGTNYATELQTIIFRPQVDDAERDNIKVKLSLCTSGGVACTTSTQVVAYTDFLRSAFTDPTQNPAIISGLNYLLPEDLLLQVNEDVNTTTERPVYFKVEVSDVPSVLTTPVKTDAKVFTAYVRNYNPAPTWSGAPNPALSAMATPSTYYDIVAGFPITLNPGVATDTSTIASESAVYYKWYISNDGATWNAIPRASDSVKNLIWTPDSGSTSPVYITACVGDRPGANAAVTTNPSQCVGNWIFNVKNSSKALSATGLTNMDTVASAVWKDTFNASVYYTAYVGTDDFIYVEKTVMNTTNDLDTTSFATIRFSALSGGGAASVIKDLSMTGTAEELYISYVASTNATPGSLIPRIRRIDKNFDNPTVNPPVLGSKENLSHGGKFGFAYTGYTISDTSSNVSSTADALNGTFRTVTFTTAPATGETVTINGYVFTASGTPTPANQICDTTACATGALAADNLADKINTSTDPLLQGLTASSGGGVVTIRGTLGADFIDWDGSISTVASIPVVQAGKLWIANSRWYLPIINTTTGTPNVVSLLSGPVGKHLQAAPLGLDDSTILATGRTLAFDNAIAASGEVIISRISGEALTAGEAFLHRFDGTTFAASAVAGTEQNPQKIFAGKTFQSVNLASTKAGNAFHYVMLQKKPADGGEWLIGRYGVNFLSGLEFFLTDRLATGATAALITNTSFLAPQLVSVVGAAEARVLFVGEAAGDYYPRIARINSSVIVNCGDCASLTTNEVSPTGAIGVSQYVVDVTLGRSGATAGENQNDSVFAVFNWNTGAAQVPYTGLIDVEAESIQSTSVDATNHFYRPAFVK